MITGYFFVDPSVNPDLFNPIQLPDFVSDLFGIHNTFHLSSLLPRESDRPVFRGASYQHAGGRQLQHQDLIVSDPAGGFRNQPKEPAK
jgi:hypothetical protein